MDWTLFYSPFLPRRSDRRTCTERTRPVGSDLIKVTFNTRAAESGMIIATFLVFPAASGVAAESPTAAEPLSLLCRLRFEGLARTVVDPDMMIEGGSSR